MGISLAFLACLKLMDPDSFARGFKLYDLVTPAFPHYPKYYPYLELFVGLGFVGGFFPRIVGLLGLLMVAQELTQFIRPFTLRAET